MIRVALVGLIFGVAVQADFVFGEEPKLLGEQEFKVAEFYDRTGHTDSACFYYELIQRRHPNTVFAQKAGQRLAVFKQAARDFDVAEFYRQRNHFESAMFYYELVLRRYPGTTFAAKAKDRVEQP
jgi:outer membrane protein assembly factor BamD (BamD/ComL family)